MTNTETETTPAAMLQAFDAVIEDRLTPKQAKPDIEIDPAFATLFKHFVAVGCDRFPAMSPMEVCAAFVQLATAGLDHPIVEQPTHSKIAPAYREPEPEYLFDRKLPHKIPLFTPPVEEFDDRNFNVNL